MSVAESRGSASYGADAARTAVFVDYQNMYRAARQAFGWSSTGGRRGNFHPHALGREIVGGRPWRLSEVRVYTGIHVPRRDPVQHGQMQRRILAWVAAAPDEVQVFPRPLRYDADGRGREKGVDVEMAVDIVSLAYDDAFDVAAIASADTDLVPALERVIRRFPTKRIVTVAYQPRQNCSAPQALDVSRRRLDRRLITERQFTRIADRANYYESSSTRAVKLDPARVERIRRRYAR